LYEFKTDKKKLKCLCGWERTMKTTDAASIDKKFAEHRAQESKLVLAGKK
jgi:hypothetical protein